MVTDPADTPTAEGSTAEGHELVSRALRIADEMLAERMETVRSAIRELGRSDVTVVAVTKGFDRSAMDAAQRVGIVDVGENYAQELVEKVPAILPGTNVHFMGRVQRNKARKVASHVDLWHSVSRREILSEIAKRSPGAHVLIQVRARNDDSKDGVSTGELDAILDHARSIDVVVRGLMTIGVLGDAERTAAAFRELDLLCETYGLAERSMGMSGDYRDALAAGATMLRLGSTLFGDRPQRR